MASYIRVNLDTSKENYLLEKCIQHDNITLEANIFENGVIKDLTGLGITINVLKPDGTFVIDTATGTEVVGNKITKLLNEQVTTVNGMAKVMITLNDAQKLQNSTFKFKLLIKRFVIEGAVASSTAVPIVQELTDKIAEAATAKAETETLITQGNAATKGDIERIDYDVEDIITFKHNDRFTNTTVEEKLNTALATGSRRVPLHNYPMEATITNPIIIDKTFSITGAGEDINKINYSGTGSVFNVITDREVVKFEDFRTIYTGTDTNSVGFIFDNASPQTEYSNLKLNNISISNFKKAGIIAKRSYNGLLSNISINADATQGTPTGILLGEADGDWNNITTISNSKFSLCKEGIKINQGVKVNITGCSFNLGSNGISLNNVGVTNETRDISIIGNYFEQNGYGIYADGAQLVTGVAIKDNYFSDINGISLKNIKDLTFQDNTFYTTTGRIGKVVLDKISNLNILGYNSLNFTTPTGGTILTTGESKYKENIVCNASTLSGWGKSVATATVLDTNTAGVERNFKALPNVNVPAGTSLVEIYSPIILAGGDITGFCSGKLFGARCVAKAIGNAGAVSVEIGYVSGNESLIAGKCIDNNFNDIKVAHIIDSATDKAQMLQFVIRITKANVNEAVTVYFDEIQGWTDFINPPINPNTTPVYSQFRRPANIENIDALTNKSIQGLYFNQGDTIRLNNGTVNTVTTAGFNYNGVPTWTASTPYKEGDYVTEGTALLRCIKSGTSGTVAPKNATGTHTYQNTEIDNTCVWFCCTNVEVRAVFA